MLTFLTCKLKRSFPDISQGKEATFDDFDELLASYDLESIDDDESDKSETKEAVSEAYACIAEIYQANFSYSCRGWTGFAHKSGLGDIEDLVELALCREQKRQLTDHAKQIIATCRLAKKRARIE